MNINLKLLNTLPIISQNFNVPLEFLQKMQYKSSTNEIYFELMKIPKKNKKQKGKFREVLKINKPYNIFHKELLHIIELTIQDKIDTFIHKIAHGFVKEKGILSNAKEHLNKKYILKVDVKNFFNSININMVEQIFVKLGCDEEGAKLFSSLCTYKNVLKEGLNTSPMLANLYCFELDIELEKIASTYNMAVTRYSDDITFSSDSNSFPAIDEIEKILLKYQLRLNHNKTCFSQYGQAQYVTGLSISNQDYPRVPRKIKRNIRTQLYYLNKYPENYFYIEDGYRTLRAIYGHIVYILGIEKELGEKYKSQFLNILESNNIYLENIFMYPPEQKETAKNVYHYIDESDITFNDNGNHYLALTVVSIHDQKLKEQNKKSLESLKYEISSDFKNGLSSKAKTKLFHYSEDNISVREKYLSLLRKLPFESFIIFIKSEKLMKKKEYQDSYYKMFNTIMQNILRRNKTDINYICIEQNSKISKNKIEENLLNLKTLPKFNIEVLAKEEILLSLPDYIMGVFRDCMKKDLSGLISKLKPEQTLKEENKLNEIIDRIRLVIDLDKSKYYSRQNKSKVTCRDINSSIENTSQSLKEAN